MGPEAATGLIVNRVRNAMTGMQRAVTAYGQAAETIPPLQQIVLLYDGAIGRLKEARSAIEEGKVPARHDAVGKAAAIVDALQRSLDHDRGGEIADNLDRLYTHLGFRMQQINLANDPAICDEVAERLGELRAAWATLLGQDQSDGAPRSGPADADAAGASGLAVNA